MFLISFSFEGVFDASILRLCCQLKITKLSSFSERTKYVNPEDQGLGAEAKNDSDLIAPAATTEALR